MSLGIEPVITVNGVTLSTAEAMTMRVALGSFLMSLQEGLGDDETGKSITRGYKRCADNIHQFMFRAAPPEAK